MIWASIVLVLILAAAVRAAGSSGEMTARGKVALGGAALGAATGAIIGVAVGLPGTGAAIGAGVGALSGSLVGAALQEHERRAETQHRQLPSP